MQTENYTGTTEFECIQNGLALVEVRVVGSASTLK